MYKQTSETIDSFFSMDEDKFMFVKQIRSAEQAFGSICYEISKSKPNVRSKRSIYISKDISKGSAFNHENIRCVRPAHGLDPRYYEDIIGKTAAKNLKAGDRLKLENINERHELKESNE